MTSNAKKDLAFAEGGETGLEGEEEDWETDSDEDAMEEGGGGAAASGAAKKKALQVGKAMLKDLKASGGGASGTEDPLAKYNLDDYDEAVEGSEMVGAGTLVLCPPWSQ